jgi:hypothetical protein
MSLATHMKSLPAEIRNIIQEYVDAAIRHEHEKKYKTVMKELLRKTDIVLFNEERCYGGIYPEANICVSFHGNWHLHRFYSERVKCRTKNKMMKSWELSPDSQYIHEYVANVALPIFFHHNQNRFQ